MDHEDLGRSFKKSAWLSGSLRRGSNSRETTFTSYLASEPFDGSDPTSGTSTSALSKDCKLDRLAARGLARYAAVDPSEPGQPFSGSILEQLHWQLQNLFRHPTGRNDCHFKDNLLAVSRDTNNLDHRSIRRINPF